MEKEIQRARKLGCSCGLAIMTAFLAVSIRGCMAFNTWMDAETYDELLERGGIETELEETLLSQLKEYATDGEVTSKLDFNVHCYGSGETQILESSNSILNVARGQECDGFAFRDPITPQSRGERIFIRNSTQESIKQAIRISCEGDYVFGTEIATSYETMPQLSDEGKPSCPPDKYGDNIVEPDYDEYLLLEGEVIKIKDQMDRIAKQQIAEFFHTRNISSRPSYKNICYESWAEISKEEGIATNFMIAKPCFGLSLRSYITQIIPQQYVGYSDYDHDTGQWDSAYLRTSEIVCVGNYTVSQLTGFKFPNLSAPPPNRPNSYRNWCPSGIDQKIVLPEVDSHRFYLEDEPIPSDLPVPPRRPDSGSPNI